MFFPAGIAESILHDCKHAAVGCLAELPSCCKDMNANKSTQREEAEEQELQGWDFFLLIVVT